MTLKPGAYIGLHAHKDNEDAYLIVSGKGVFTDGNGNAWVVGPGDMTLARPGQSHGLANLSKETSCSSTSSPRTTPPTLKRSRRTPPANASG